MARRPRTVLLFVYSEIKQSMLPSIGSNEFRALSFREQLEVLSLQLFNPAEYEARCKSKKPTSSGLTWKLEYPSITDLKFADLPVSVLRGHWAVYICHFKEKWYAEDYSGLTPLDDYGIECKRMVNAWMFTFPVLVLDPAFYYIASWLLDIFKSRSRVNIVLLASKVYLSLYMRMVEHSAIDVFRLYSKPVGGDPWHLVKDAMDEYKGIFNFTALNYYCPIMEECNELVWFENKEFMLHEKPRCKGGRWFYPLVPMGLFTAPNFRINSWQFLK